MLQFGDENLAIWPVFGAHPLVLRRGGIVSRLRDSRIQT